MPRCKKAATTEPTAPLRRSSRKRASTASPEGEGNNGSRKRVKVTSSVPQAATSAPNFPSTPVAGPSRLNGVTTSPQVNPIRIPSPNFSGNFDIYDMDDPDLSDVYLNENGPPDFEALYESMVAKQGLDEETARVYIASPAAACDSSRFQSTYVSHPLDDKAYSITMHGIGHHQQLAMPTLTYSSGLPETIPGITASLSLEEEDPAVAGSFGTFHLRRIWTKNRDNGEIIELFEGYFYFTVMLYRHMDLGESQVWRNSFWAVRARVDLLGYEIGLPSVPRVPRVSVKVGDKEPAKHPTAKNNPMPPVKQRREYDQSQETDELKSVERDGGDNHQDEQGEYEDEPMDEQEEEVPQQLLEAMMLLTACTGVLAASMTALAVQRRLLNR